MTKRVYYKQKDQVTPPSQAVYPTIGYRDIFSACLLKFQDAALSDIAKEIKRQI